LEDEVNLAQATIIRKVALQEEHAAKYYEPLHNGFFQRGFLGRPPAISAAKGAIWQAPRGGLPPAGGE
jgi:hypothetical protein